MFISWFLLDDNSYNICNSDLIKTFYFRTDLFKYIFTLFLNRANLLGSYLRNAKSYLIFTKSEKAYIKNKTKKNLLKKKLALKKSLTKFIDKKYHQKTINAHEKIRIVSCIMNALIKKTERLTLWKKQDFLALYFKIKNKSVNQKHNGILKRRKNKSCLFRDQLLTKKENMSTL